MTTIRPNDFFLGEDAPAEVVHQNGSVSAKLVANPDCAISAQIHVPDDFEATALDVRIYVRSSGEASTVGLRARLIAWPTIPSSIGPITGEEVFVVQSIFSINPAMIAIGVQLGMPEEYEAGMALSIQISNNVDDGTPGLEPHISTVTYAPVQQ